MVAKFTAGAVWRSGWRSPRRSAGAGELAGGDRWTATAACALAALGVAGLVLARFGPVAPPVLADAAMGASSTAALAVAARRRPGRGDRRCRRSRRPRAQPLAAGPRGAARAHRPRGAGRGSGLAPLAAVAWPQPPGCCGRPPEPRPEFSPVVLTAILAFATLALALLTAGQFTGINRVAIALAAVTVLTGMARAGITVLERLRAPRAQALTDDLTGLGNRRHLLDGCTPRSRRADRAELALPPIDLDGFKELNDTLGHHAGDEVLRQIGPRLKCCCAATTRSRASAATSSPSCSARRRGVGDHRWAAAARRARAAPSRSAASPCTSTPASASRSSPSTRTTPGAAAARRRRDVPGQAQRTGHEVHLAGRDLHSRQRLALIAELGGALEAGQLILHYQPKAELRTGAVRGVEALVRWEHPERGLLGPGHFLPPLEHSGLTRALTTFVLDRALQEVRALRGARPDLRVAVNLGPADLLDLGLPAEVERLLVPSRLPAPSTSCSRSPRPS